jgi:hypothetical protein
MAERGASAGFATAAAPAAYVGVVPGLKQLGKRQGKRADPTPIGPARLRRALWMPTLVAVQKSPWVGAHDVRLRANGKPAKVALIASTRHLMIARSCTHKQAKTRKTQRFQGTPHVANVRGSCER